MAVIQINLSDPVTTLVTKTNTIASDMGDAATLTTTATNLVAAINEINTQVNKVDSADVINLIRANAMDSSEVVTLLASDSAQANILSNFQKDSANGIGLDSSQGRFFIPSNVITPSMVRSNAITEVKIANNSITESKMADDAISSVELKSLSTLLIKDSAGSTLKTIHGAGV